MSKKALECLPFELVSKVYSHLSFSDVWYLGTCSRKSRTLAFQILKSKYQIDFLNPFSHLVYGAIAYMDRYGHKNNRIELNVLQSVANHLAIVIYDRLPIAKSTQLYSYDFLLDQTISILFHYAILDPTLHSLKNPQDKGIKDPQSYSRQVHQLSAELEQKIRHQQTKPEDPYATRSTGVLTVDFLSILSTTLDGLFDGESREHQFHEFFMLHLRRLFNAAKDTYQQYHARALSKSQLMCMDLATRDFQLFFRLFCVIIQTDLCTQVDIDCFASSCLGRLFITRPSDVSFTATRGLKIFVRHSVLLQEPTSKSIPQKTLFDYQWRLWLKETQLRLTLLLIILQSLIQKCYGVSQPLSCRNITSMLQDTASVLSWTENESPEDISYVELSYSEQ